MAVLGGVGGFGGGDGLRRPCSGGGGVGGGGVWPFGPEDRLVVAFVGRLERKLSFLGGGLGGFGFAWGGGGVWAVVVDPYPPSPPSSPSLTPPPPMLPHISSSPPPPRKPHLLHPSPLPGPEVARRHPYAAHHARSLPVVETAQESKAQGWIPGHDAMEGPQGYLLGALGVSPGHPNGPGIRRVDHHVNDLQKKIKTKKVNSFFRRLFEFFDFNINS